MDCQRRARPRRSTTTATSRELVSVHREEPLVEQDPSVPRRPRRRASASPLSNRSQATPDADPRLGRQPGLISRVAAGRVGLMVPDTRVRSLPT